MNENFPNGDYTKINEEKESSISLRQIIDTIWSLRYWIILSIICAMVIAVVIIKSTTPLYERKTSVLLVNDDGKGGLSGEMALIAEITGSSVSQKLENEMFILKSSPLMLKVVEDLNLNVRYFKTGIFRDIELYKTSPIVFEYVKNNKDESLPNIQLTVDVVDSKSFSIVNLTVNGTDIDLNENDFLYDDAIACGNGYFTINQSKNTSLKDLGLIKIDVIDHVRCAKQYANSLITENTGNTRGSKGSDIVSITLKDSNRNRADDILSTLVKEYNEDSRLYRTQSITGTLNFINERLNSVEQELGIVESDLTHFKETQSLVNVESQSQLALTTDVRFEQELISINTQISLLGMIKNNLKAQKGKYDIIPANIGITDIGLTTTIEQYNRLVIEYNRLLSSSSENNPRVINAGLQLNQMRESIDMSITNLENAYKIQEKTLSKRVHESKKKISDMPAQQQEMLRLARQQQIKEPLFLLLQQKREEAMISSYSMIENARVIEPAYGSDSPVSPKKNIILLVAFVLGCIVPPGIYYLKEALRTKIITKHDIDSHITVQVFAVIPKLIKDNDKFTPINISGKDAVTESFRMLRANLQFVDAKVIQVVSSIPDEGKSFVASNLSASLAYAENKVLLMGLDLRKPMLQENFNLKNNFGIVNYLSGKTNDLDSLVQKTQISDNLDVVISGPIPPNPSELLSTNKIAEMIEHFKDKYDYIILDTSPCFLTSDPIVIAKYSDSTLYIVRSRLADLNFLPKIQKMYDGKKFKNMSIVLNGFDTTKKNYGYGYSSYGYGGYGYGSYDGYNEESKDKKPKRRISFKKFFK